MNKLFNDRKVDKKKLDKSKQYLWRHIQKKKKLGGFAEAKTKAKEAKGGFFASLFAPRKIAWASAIAAITIIAVLVGPNLQNLLRGGIGTSQQVAYASFEMTPSNQDSAGIETDTTFTLTSTEDFEPAVIEANLEATPDVDINVSKTAKGEYEITTVEPLNPNTVYTFKIVSQTENGPEEFSWAYQVKDDFKISGTLPGDKTSGVPTSSGIEINFSHEQFDTKIAENYITISPEVQGRFEKYQRVLVFVPSGGLNPETIYTVTINEGLPMTGSDKTLKESKIFQFETSQEGGEKSYFHFDRDFTEIGTDKPIAITGYFSAYGRDLKPEEVKVNATVYKVGGQEEYLSLASQKQQLPTWAYAARSNFKVDTKSLKQVAQIEGEMGNLKWQNYLHLPDLKLEEGYYVLQAEIQGHLSQCFLQITDLSSYVTVTKTDSIAWVNDVKTGKPVANATVKVAETGETAKTDQNGIAKFKLLPKEYGYYNLVVNTQDGKTLVTELGVVADTPTGDDYWNLLVTDRPVYLPKDTVQFWGFMKPRTGSLTAPKDLTIKFTRGWSNDFIKIVDFKMESDSTFSGSFDLKDVPPGYYTLAIYDGENYLMQSSIQVQTYKKPTYNIQIKSDRDAYYVGETINYEITTVFFDGTPMPNLQLSYNDKTVKTDALGKANVSIPAEAIYPCDESSLYCSNVDHYYLTVRPVVGEDSDIFEDHYVAIFKSRLNLEAVTKTDEKTATVDISANWVDLNNPDENYIGKAASGKLINGVITEKYWEKIETGEYYDFIEKKVIKEYRHEQRQNPFGTFSVETDSQGKAKHSFVMNDEKYYEIRLTASDDNGNKTYTTTYAYGASDFDNDYYRIKVLNANQEGLNYFNLNDEVKIAFVSEENPIGDLKGGNILFLEYNMGLVGYSVKNSAYSSFKFEQKHAPGTKIEGVWFDGETYRHAWGDYARLDTKEKELSIDIKTDKESYSPGEKVNLSIEVVDKNGKPVQSEVLINLVDEAYYKAVYDNFTEPLSMVYGMPDDGILSVYSTHRDAKVMTGAGEMGGCFTADTKILMSNGAYKKIKDIKAGDVIKTRKSPLSNELVDGTVKGTVEHLVMQYLVINENLEVTGEHVILVNGKWNTADKIKIGDSLLGKDGQTVPVVSIRKVTAPTYVYNFEVENYHTYIANDIYVHNDKGGVRSDFDDTAVFKSVNTNGNGKAVLDFKLPDNVTTWRVSAIAINSEKVLVGGGKGFVKVTLPLFGDFIMNREYSVKDSPIIGLRAFGEALTEVDDVSFALTAKSLGLTQAQKFEGKAYLPTYQPLPELTRGQHKIQLDVESKGKKDSLQEEITVKGSRLNKSVVEVIPTVKSGADIPMPDSGYAQAYLMDAGISSYYWSLMHLYYSHGERFEKRLGEQASIELLKEYFDQDFASHYETDLIEYQRWDGGLAILPYADSDLELTALTLAFDNNPERYGSYDLKEYLKNYYLNKNSNLEEITLSLLGLASLREPVLTSLQAIQNEENLSVEDKFYIGLAFGQLGSKADAVKMYNRAVKEIDSESVRQNALATVLAASIQYKDQAVEHWSNALFYADEDDLLNLYLLGYARAGLAYASEKEVSFNVGVGGLNERKTLSLCEVFGVLVSGSEGMKISEVEGDLAAVVFYETPIEPSEFKRDNRVKITRSYEIVGDPNRSELRVDDMVKITLNFSIDESIPETNYHIVDVLPSGLQVLARPVGFIDYGHYLSGPYRIKDQEIHFNYYPDQYSQPVRTYYAKVIHPGEFYADPAKIEAFEKPEIANITEAKKIIIR